MSRALTPAAWADVTLGDVCAKPQYGWTTPAARSGDLRLLRTTDLTHGPISWDTVPFCAEEPVDAGSYLVEAGDILVSRAGSVGVSVLIEEAPVRAVFASYLIRLKTTERVLPKYLKLFLTSPDYWDQISDMSSGIALLNINGTKLRGLRIPLPPLAEQHQIVDLLEDHLSRLDAAVASLRGAKEKALQLNRSLLRRVFANELRPPGGGSVSLWPTVELGSLAAGGGLFVDGDWVESKDQDPQGDVRLTQLADVGEGYFRDRSDRRLRTDQAERLGVTYLSKGDLLIARMPDPLGRCCTVPDLPTPAVTVVDVAVLRVRRQDVLPSWVMWFLNSPTARSAMVALASGTTRQRVSRKNLSTIRVPVPSVEEQRALVALIEGAIDATSAATSRCDAGEALANGLRRSLLHAAFTGELTKTWREKHHG